VKRVQHKAFPQTAENADRSHASTQVQQKPSDSVAVSASEASYMTLDPALPVSFIDDHPYSQILPSVYPSTPTPCPLSQVQCTGPTTIEQKE
jgi:hypothetical protein